MRKPIISTARCGKKSWPKATGPIRQLRQPPIMPNEYYIYLKYLYAPTISTTSRVKLPGKTNVNNIADISFFVLPNSTAEIDVPIGVYKLYYCYGKEWLGRDEKFGESTRFAASDDLLTFYTDTE